MSISISAWTFLVSRNQELDYRSVIIPDFLSSDGSTKLLEKVADEDVTFGEHGSETIPLSIRWCIHS